MNDNMKKILAALLTEIKKQDSRRRLTQMTVNPQRLKIGDKVKVIKSCVADNKRIGTGEILQVTDISRDGVPILSYHGKEVCVDPWNYKKI